MLDADEAGQKAIKRAEEILRNTGLSVRVVSIPNGKDPDEYIKRFGVDRFKQVINGAKSKFDYSLDVVLSKYDIQLPQDKINALNELEKMISEVYSAAERDIYIRTVAQKLGVDFASIKSDVDRIIAKNVSAYKRGQTQRLRQQSAGYGDSVNIDFNRNPVIARNEENVLGLLLLFPEHRKKVFAQNLLAETDFVTDLNRRIFAYLQKAYSDGDENLVAISEAFTDAEMGRISKIKIMRMELASADEDILQESIETLKRSVGKKEAKESTDVNALEALLNKKRNS